MELTNKIKDRVVNCLLEELQKRGCSQAEFAKMIAVRHAIKFDKAVLPQIKKSDNRNYAAIKETSWLILARYYNVLGESTWTTVKTKAYISVQAHLEKCQNFGIWQVLCDRAGIGKSYAAAEYARTHSNVFYIDCSDYSAKSDFITCLAGQFGLEKTGSLNKLWREVTNELLLLESPLLILDEFGDCADAIVTLMKGLYNKANMGDRMALGCYFIGADNLEKKLIDGRRTKKCSYAEFWSRFNERVTGLNYGNKPQEFLNELQPEIEAIVDANLPEELRDSRNVIIEKSLATRGVRAIRNEIAIQKMLFANK